MRKEDIRKFSLNDISQHADPHSISNFILSQNIPSPPNIKYQEPFIFDGVIFGICLKGKGKIMVNSREYEVIPNTLFVLLPHHLIEMKERSDDFLISTLYFSVDFIIGLQFPRDFDSLMNMREVPFFQISGEECTNLIEMYSYTLKQYNRVNHIYREEIVKAQLYTLLLEASSIARKNKDINKKKSTSRQEELIERFFRLLVKHYKEERTVTFYADKMCLTPKYLSSVIKKSTGYPLSKWINELILIEAKKLLKTSDMTVLQISEELNFPNPSFFGRFFKENIGITPLKYKNGFIE